MARRRRLEGSKEVVRLLAPEVPVRATEGGTLRSVSGEVKKTGCAKVEQHSITCVTLELEQPMYDLSYTGQKVKWSRFWVRNVERN